MFVPEGSTNWCGYSNAMYYAEAIAGQEYAQWRRYAEPAGADGVAGAEPDHIDAPHASSFENSPVTVMQVATYPTTRSDAS